ncbi:MAG: hypothetical protein HQK87_05150 [Nitrospinae bacterium]|nr:hypothetical protein [Nitrospinota bacterium]
MATITKAPGGAPAVPERAERPKPKRTKAPIRPADRADEQRKQAGRAAYKQPVNMGMPNPIVSAKRAITGTGDKVDTEG